MKSIFTKFAEQIFAYPNIYCIYYLLRSRIQYIKWLTNGKKFPVPHIVKQIHIKNTACAFNLHTFVETGTYRGDMVYAMRNKFKKIYSIELDNTLHKKARARFMKYNHIHMLSGDSGKILGNIVKKLDKPALFWLDGHYSGGITAQGEKKSPVFEELYHIFNVPDFGHVILIDDASCFIGKNDFPKISDLKNIILSYRPELNFSVNDDIIIIYSKQKKKCRSLL